ncbi:MAG: 50S ribosomal protein L11 [Candidatus Iainarchaeum archaeon]|uniref:Large ribosomal subunit protein uL11 n=1 Tax=Candidatus Iainarchaeum sp. TaxID=3101447 RepID=A0A497JIL8_9ARCH|nr:MAG: 50S ribosomal protein L11 [Candidatus Diapherotrites archaeon]
MPEVNAVVEAGKATAAPPLGPALGPLGVNIGKVIEEINKKTKPFEGMKVPIKVIVDPATKEFRVEVGSPSVAALIKKELNIKKGASNVKEAVGNLTLQQVKKIAEMKFESMSAKDLKAAVCEVLGTCNSMGVFVEGKRAKEIIKKIKAGEISL